VEILHGYMPTDTCPRIHAHGYMPTDKTDGGRAAFRT
jgi:hypothetical protein